MQLALQDIGQLTDIGSPGTDARLCRCSEGADHVIGVAVPVIADTATPNDERLPAGYISSHPSPASRGANGRGGAGEWGGGGGAPCPRDGPGGRGGRRPGRGGGRHRPPAAR